MILFFIALCAVALIVYGIWEHKHIYGKQQFCEAEVVGYESYRGGTLFSTTVAASPGFVNPVVRVTLSDGSTQDVKLYTKVMTETIKTFPEFEIGGRVDVLFFGDSPKEVYLVNHSMAETVLKFSIPLVVGISIAAVDVMIVALILFVF